MKIHIEMRLSLYAANFNGILGFDFFIFSDGLYLLFAWDFGFELLTGLFTAFQAKFSGTLGLSF